MLFDRVIQYILNPIAYLLIGLAVITFLQWAIWFIAKADDPEAREEGKKHLIWGIIGLFIIAAAYGILNFIQGTLLVLFNKG